MKNFSYIASTQFLYLAVSIVIFLFFISIEWFIYGKPNTQYSLSSHQSLKPAAIASMHLVDGACLTIGETTLANQSQLWVKEKYYLRNYR